MFVYFVIIYNWKRDDNFGCTPQYIFYGEVGKDISYHNQLLSFAFNCSMKTSVRCEYPNHNEEVGTYTTTLLGASKPIKYCCGIRDEH